MLEALESLQIPISNEQPYSINFKFEFNKLINCLNGILSF